VQIERTVLAIVHTVTAGIRLGDVVPMLEEDPRVQVIYTHPLNAMLSAGADAFLARIGGVVVPWDTIAIQHTWDLALAAHHGGLEQVHAPVVSIPHGTGFSKYEARWDGNGPKAARHPSGPERARLIDHSRVIASAHLLPTREQAEELRRSCPEAAESIMVTGDPCFDRLAASLPCRARYREALGTGDRTLVAVTSTWGSGALIQARPTLLTELTSQLPPDRYQIAWIQHPNVFHWHGGRSTLMRNAESVRRGVVLIPPEEGWRGTIAACDVVIGDHGSVTCYAAAAGIPVVLGAYPAAEVVPGSLVSRLADVVHQLRPGEPYPDQLEAAMAAWNRIGQMHVTDFPGQAAERIRSCLYQLMRLREPTWRPRTQPVPVPRPLVLPETFGGGW
jgi:hypothetical protein